MKDGDLVELLDSDGSSKIVVGSLNGNSVDRLLFPAGTLAVRIKRFLAGEKPASVILVDGFQGWVWNDELQLANITHDGGDYETR